MVLQLPGLLQVLLHPPDVVNRGLEDGALVPAHIPAGQAKSEMRAQRSGQVFAGSLVGANKTLLWKPPLLGKELVTSQMGFL